MAAHRSIHRRSLAYYPETTAAIAPADGTAWLSDGVPIEFISVDVNPKQQLYVDPTAERRIMANGKRLRVKGVRWVDWSATLKWHGLGAATATDDQAAHSYLSTIMTWVCGGATRTYTRVIASSANAYTLTLDVGDEAGFVAGCLIAVEDTTSATAENAGKLHFAQIASISGQDLTLTEALPFTPAQNDVIHGTVTVYVDEDYLEDAIRNSAIRTYSWLYQASTNSDEIWQLEGTVAHFKLGNLNRGQMPQVTLSMMSANFKHSSDDSLSYVNFGAAAGKPPLSMGLDVRCSLSPTGATTRVSADLNAADFESGFTRVRVETLTEEVDRFGGMSTYSVAPGETKLTMTVVPHDSIFYAALADETTYRCMLYQPGPGGGAAASAGKAWAICIPKGQIAETPSRVDVNEIHGEQIVLSAMLPTAAGSATEMAQSPFLLGFA